MAMVALAAGTEATVDEPMVTPEAQSGMAMVTPA